MKKNFLLLFFLIILSVTLSACLSSKTLNIKYSNALNNVDTTNLKVCKGYEYITSNENLSERYNQASLILFDKLDSKNKDNFIASPLGVSLCLSLLNYISDDTVKGEVQELLSLSDDDLNASKNIIDLISFEKDDAKLLLSNSIWVDKELTTDAPVFQELADKFYCYGYQTPFKAKINKANDDIKRFISYQTKGLINKSFDFTADTIFALINTLYLKDKWGSKDLKTRNLTFHGIKEEEITFLEGNTVSGDINSTDISQYVYTETASRFSMIFVVPNEGHEVSDVMTISNLSEVLAGVRKASSVDDVYTKVIFPKFSLTSDTDIMAKFQEQKIMPNAFLSFNTKIIDEPVLINKFINSCKLKVDEKGIEGASAVVMGFAKNASFSPECKEYIVDRPFGLIVMYNNTILFMGRVYKPEK